MYPLLQNWPAAAATAETLLVRRDKEDVLFLTNLGMYPGTALKLRVPMTQKDVLVVMAALGRQGVVQGKDYRGVDVVSVLLPIPDSPWFIVAKQDAAEVFAQWRDHARFLLTLFAALAGGLVVLGVLAWQEHQMARYKRLYRTEARLRREAKQANAALLEAEEEREKLDAQFQQSQKMESVGRLAGGVAHDYNNMLNVILGYAELALGKIDPGDPLHADLEKIHGAATRSADITRQLLAFARKQTIDPKVLDLNRTIDGGILQILHRLMREDIDLAWQPAETLWSVKMDPVQIDQILANLCVNARDAIADVGKITIETGTKTFDQAYCDDHPGFIPGDFVMLAVSDDGCGMDKQTRENMFEPFFTTKKAEKGTGLGLATVYGIVKQNNGFINVYSEPEKGTTIRIYLSRHTELPEQIPPGKQTRMQSGHGETVLVVEDETVILDLACAMLENLGYTTLAAASPDAALHLARTHAGKIHLVITDVVMPGMNGRDLAAQLTQLYPDLKVLFMSGYTANVIAHHGVLDPGVHFMQKPFSMDDIAAKVQEVMNDALL
ncbi:MAG: ATP-binding protein [Desulfotignum sp.]